jgi:uncharacterized protein (UPF0305 family)
VDKIDPKIINISSKDLSNSEIRLLKRGLKFTPTPRPNKDELVSDIKGFTRKLRLMEYFNSQEHSDDQDISNEHTIMDVRPIVSNKSKFIPQSNRDKYLDNFINTIESFPLEKNHLTKDNLSHDERHALRNIQHDTSIIIKEADKGGAVVIMNASYYETKLNEMLDDTAFYEESTLNDKTVLKNLHKLITKYSTELHDKEIAYLLYSDFSTANFYGLPKIHKSKCIQMAIEQQNSEYVKTDEPNDLSFRPIVGGPRSPTQRLSNFLDILLKPIATSVPSYIRDDIDFLKQLPNSVPENAILTTFDIVGLFTNIPTDLGMKAVKHFIEKSRDLIEGTFSSNFILDALKFILDNNTFDFNGKHMRQIKGCAMGSKVSPTYATLVVAYLEEILFNNMKDNSVDISADYFKTNWKRYLDDCFLIWTNNDDSVKKFHSILNNLDPSIQFTMNMDHYRIPFLDIEIIKEGVNLVTDMYYKPTDTHQYLQFHSCHPKHTKINIPYSMARRICTIVTDRDRRENRLSDLRAFLRKQGYPIGIIDSGINRVKHLPLDELRKPSNKPCNQNETITLVTTYNPNNTQIMPVIHNHLPILLQSSKMKACFSKRSIINSTRQPKNLKRILSPSVFISNTSKYVSKCGVSRCGTCDLIVEGNTFNFADGKTFQVHANMNCKTPNVIYAITCTGCKENYIGETGMELRYRVTLHKQHIRDSSTRVLWVSHHIETCGNGKFIIFPFYKVMVDDKHFRQAKEAHFIKIFKPKLNRR